MVGGRDSRGMVGGVGIVGGGRDSRGSGDPP